MLLRIRLILIVWMAITVLSLGAIAEDVKRSGQLLSQANAEGTAAIEVDTQPEAQLPLQLTIEPSNTEFFLGEKVEFELTLLNRGEAPLRVKEIDATTTTCVFNGLRWGTMEASGPNNVILAPGEALRKKMRFLPRQAGNLDISCSYGMGFKGIRPSAHVSLTIK